MPHTSSQTFLRELDKKLWTSFQKGAQASRLSFRRNLKPTTWRLAAMNMAIRGIDFDFGKDPADTFTRDQHPDLRADFVMALPSAAARLHPRSHTADRPNGRINPPFNIKEWWDGTQEVDARLKYGTPPQTAMLECAPLKPEGTPQVVSEARDKNANFAWVQHMLHHLAPSGSMALLLANGSMSSESPAGPKRNIQGQFVHHKSGLDASVFLN